MAAVDVRSMVIVGGGLNGLATLFHGLRLGATRPLLLERFQVGHDRASSHGPSRIARSTYPHVGYVRLMRATFAEEWPRLERAAEEPLLFRSSGVFFGPPNGPIDAYAKAVADAGVEVDRLDLRTARAMFPMLRFGECDFALHDRTAALIASARVLRALERVSRAGGAEIQSGTRVLAIDPTHDPIRIETDRGEIFAERVVVTAGPWMSELAPALAPRLFVARQNLAYFELEGSREEFRVGRFPVFARIGAGENDFYYGLPEFDHPGVKVARHVTTARDDDPETPSGTFDEDALEDLRAFAIREFVPAVRGLAGADTCMYTCTATEDFVLAPHPANPRLVFGSACSGHAFKFGPMIGRILAELALWGDCRLPEYQALRTEFSWVGPPSPADCAFQPRGVV
ncbi:MAG: FAD-dependent oxidoreductase [Planctomycetes bacterium]|nr:FAD-dependent oxidoreductase [Planctomycetota bacterium]